MDQLLQGYASPSDDDGNTEAKPDHPQEGVGIRKDLFHDSVVADKGDPGAASQHLPTSGKAYKRPKLGPPTSSAQNSSQAVSLAAKQQSTCLTASRISVADAVGRRDGSRSALPNPLVLLEASNDEERLGALAASGPALPAPAGPARVRAFPHVSGNFPTVVLLPVQGMDDQLDAVYRRVRRLLPDLQPMAVDPEPVWQGGSSGAAAPAGGRRGPGSSSSSQGVHRGYHISLSRTVPIRHEQIAPLTEAMAERLRGIAGSFRISLAGVRSFANDAATTTFVSLMVGQGAQQVCSLIRGVDVAFKRHGLSPFYEVPLPHVSVGWLPGDRRGKVDAALRRLGSAALSGPVGGAAEAKAAAGAPVMAAAGTGGTACQAAAVPAPNGTDGAPAAAAPPGGGDGGVLAAAGEVVCSWQASRAVCVVGIREYEVWRAAAAAAVDGSR